VLPTIEPFTLPEGKVTSQVLSAGQVGVAFAGLSALRQVDLQVRAGQVVGLIGPNGAGKTTMVNVLTGFQKPSSGTVSLGGRVLNRLPAHVFRQLGIARTFQAGRLFKGLTVLENLVVTSTALGQPLGVSRVQAKALLEQMKIAHLASQLAGGLPYTDERRVAIARALMERPHFVLLDEPAAGMSDHEASDLARLIRAMAAERGCGVLLIEHNVRMVLETCTHIVVLDSGAVIASGNPEAIRHSEVVRHAYMGTTAELPEQTEAALG